MGLLLLLAGCQRHIAACPSLDRLRLADARGDAVAAMGRGDRHLIMLGGYVGTIPGGEAGNLPTELLAGTGDDATTACAALRSSAESYALRYNKTVKAALVPR